MVSPLGVLASCRWSFHAVQLVERLSRPVAEVYLVEFGADRDFADSAAKSDRQRRLLRALARAA
jgi:hypothetical protein